MATVVGETVFLVLKAEFTTGVDKLTLYPNPLVGLPEPATGTIKSDADIGLPDALTVYSTGEFSLDELRVGRTFEDVTPLPEPGLPAGLLVGAFALIGSPPPLRTFVGRRRALLLRALPLARARSQLEEEPARH